MASRLPSNLSQSGADLVPTPNKASSSTGEDEQNNSNKYSRGGSSIEMKSSYRDFSRADTVALNDPTSWIYQEITLKEPPFPVKLHMIVSNPETQDIICWLPHGRSWVILNQKAFVEKILPQHFRHGRYASFARQVNGWGFRRVTSGTDLNSYYHELFLRGMPHLCSKMRRLTSKDIKMCKKTEDAKAPDFYELSRRNPLEEGKSASARQVPKVTDKVEDQKSVDARQGSTSSSMLLSEPSKEDLEREGTTMQDSSCPTIPSVATRSNNKSPLVDDISEFLKLLQSSFKPLPVHQQSSTRLSNIEDHPRKINSDTTQNDIQPENVAELVLLLKQSVAEATQAKTLSNQEAYAREDPQRKTPAPSSEDLKRLAADMLKVSNQSPNNPSGIAQACLQPNEGIGNIMSVSAHQVAPNLGLQRNTPVPLNSQPDNGGNGNLLNFLLSCVSNQSRGSLAGSSATQASVQTGSENNGTMSLTLPSIPNSTPNMMSFQNIVDLLNRVTILQKLSNDAQVGPFPFQDTSRAHLPADSLNQVDTSYLRNLPRNAPSSSLNSAASLALAEEAGSRSRAGFPNTFYGQSNTENTSAYHLFAQQRLPSSLAHSCLVSANDDASNAINTRAPVGAPTNSTLVPTDALRQLRNPLGMYTTSASSNLTIRQGLVVSQPGNRQLQLPPFQNSNIPTHNSIEMEYEHPPNSK